METSFVTAIAWEAQRQDVLFSLNTGELQIVEKSQTDWRDSICRSMFLASQAASMDVGGDVVYAPISLTALAVANSVEYGGLGLNEMRMSPDVLALMLAGGDGVNSGEWGDVLGNSPTAVDNHGCGLPVLDAMQILRSGASAQNQLLSSWFQATLPAGQLAM